MGAMRGKGGERHMGYSILELVLRQLRQQGFAADAAYPGQKFPQVQGPVAAVHIDQVDRANLSVTVSASVLCPAAQGGTACEMEALKVTEVLRWMGAVCVQNGCRYDGIAQVYVVEVLATFTGVTEETGCQIWPGLYVYVNETMQKFAVAFTEEVVTGAEAAYAMGEAAPVGIRQGQTIRKLYLEELIPAGSPEEPEPEGEFQLRLVSTLKTQRYLGCRWVRTRREFTQKGLRRIREGIALGREEVTA